MVKGQGWHGGDSAMESLESNRIKAGRDLRNRLVLSPHFTEGSRETQKAEMT